MIYVADLVWCLQIIITKSTFQSLFKKRGITLDNFIQLETAILDTSYNVIYSKSPIEYWSTGDHPHLRSIPKVWVGLLKFNINKEMHWQLDKFRITGFFMGPHPWLIDIPWQGASNAESFSMQWRHHVYWSNPISFQGSRQCKYRYTLACDSFADLNVYIGNLVLSMVENRFNQTSSEPILIFYYLVQWTWLECLRLSALS